MIDAFPINSYNDYNFDGYKDICIFNNNFKNPEKSKTGFYYLYDKNKQKYIIEKQLEYLDITSVCKKDKVLKALQSEYEDLSVYKSNPKIIHSVLRTYKWVNNSLKEIESIEEKELSHNNYKIKKVNIEKNEIKVFKSKKSIISNINCR